MKHTKASFGLLFASVVVLFSSTGFSVEALHWQKTVIERSATAKQKKVDAEFLFKNEGSAVITIKSVTPGCDCTTATLSKSVYQPGESGVISATFIIGERVGLQVKSISVLTEENPSEPIMLTLRVTIPELIEIQPRLLRWPVGGDPVEKSVDVLLATDPQLTITKLQSPDTDFEVRLETIQAHRQYRVWLRPKSTILRVRSSVNVQTLAANGGSTHGFNIYAQVQ